jgi:hypothetical protein
MGRRHVAYRLSHTHSPPERKLLQCTRGPAIRRRPLLHDPTLGDAMRYRPRRSERSGPWTQHCIALTAQPAMPPRSLASAEPAGLDDGIVEARARHKERNLIGRLGAELLHLVPHVVNSKPV